VSRLRAVPPVKANMHCEHADVMDSGVVPPKAVISFGELIWRAGLILGASLVLGGTIISFIESQETLQERTDRARKELIQNCESWTLSVQPDETLITSCNAPKASGEDRSLAGERR
jgi:hypothetical protein